MRGKFFVSVLPYLDKINTTSSMNVHVMDQVYSKLSYSVITRNQLLNTLGCT